MVNPVNVIFFDLATLLLETGKCTLLLVYFLLRSKFSKGNIFARKYGDDDDVDVVTPGDDVVQVQALSVTVTAVRGTIRLQ